MYVYSVCRPTRWVERSAATHAIEWDAKKQRKPNTVKHKYDDPVTSLDYAHVHKSDMYAETQLVKSTHQQVIECLPKLSSAF